MITHEESSGGEAEEGENYFISMTDMMVGVLFIFIIMLMVFALDFRTKTDVNEDAIDVAREVARKLEDLRREVHDEISALDEAQQTRTRMLVDIETQLNVEGLNVQIDQKNGVLRLTEAAVRFDVNRSDLVGDARINVGKIAKVLERVLPTYTACRVEGDRAACRKSGGSTLETLFIEGHTDVTGVTDANERARRNWQLSAERSINTYREMVAEAPALRQLRNLRQEEIVSVSGYASTRPIDPNEGREGWAKNRRIDLRFVMEVDSRERLKEILQLTDEMKDQIDRLTAASGAGL
jgi:chemotaxis protein MotB